MSWASSNGATAMRIAVILPAAGLGKRFVGSGGENNSKGPKSKLEQDLRGRPVFLRAAELFVGKAQVQQILLAVNPQSMSEFMFKWGDKLGFHGVEVVAGGQRGRWETVLKALDRVQAQCTHVAIHDAARPLTSSGLIEAVFEAARDHPAVIPGLPVSSTLKRVAEVAEDREGEPNEMDDLLGAAPSKRRPSELKRIVETMDRRDLVEAQTPQVFEVSLLRKAYARLAELAQAQDWASLEAVTDDAGVVEMAGEVVRVVPGESSNIKITYQNDLDLALALMDLQEQAKPRLGPKRLFADDED